MQSVIPTKATLVKFHLPNHPLDQDAEQDAIRLNHLVIPLAEKANPRQVFNELCSYEHFRYLQQQIREEKL